MIVYFSATGNSKYAAERIASALNEKAVSIEEKRYDITLEDGECFGIVTPTHWWALPVPMREFLHKLRLHRHGKHYVFIASTYGTTVGCSGEEARHLLKDNGIEVKWVQVGNETTHGFLWPMGRAEENMAQYAGLSQAGYDAVKAVYPNAICIVHLDGGCDPTRYHFIFDGLKQYGAKWDMIGLSVYPYWDIDAKLTSSEDETLERAIANINALYEKYHTPLMIVETGDDADRAMDGKRFMERLIDAARHQTNGHCQGVFYWAPEAEGHYRLGAFRNHRPTAIMDAFNQ